MSELAYDEALKVSGLYAHVGSSPTLGIIEKTIWGGWRSFRLHPIPSLFMADPPYVAKVLGLGGG